MFKKKEEKKLTELYTNSYKSLEMLFIELYDLGKILKELKESGLYIPPEYNLIDIDIDKYCTYCGKHVLVKTNLGERLIRLGRCSYFIYSKPFIKEVNTDTIYELDSNGYVYTPHKYSNNINVKSLEFEEIFRFDFKYEMKLFSDKITITSLDLTSKLTSKEILDAIEELLDIYDKIVNYLAENDLFMYNIEKKNDVLMGLQGLY